MPLQGASQSSLPGRERSHTARTLQSWLTVAWSRMENGAVLQSKEHRAELDGHTLSLDAGEMASSEGDSERMMDERRHSTDSTIKHCALRPHEQGRRESSGGREPAVHFEDHSESDEGWVGLTEQDVEAAFAHLALAFRCDMFTLRRRLQVEERARNTAEENIQQELAECQAMLPKLDQACLDPRHKELVEHLTSSLTVLAAAIERATVAAEKLGAVHQEARMSRATEVMVQHIENLKRHHLREHTELKEMKRLIQQNSRNRQLSENRDEGDQRLKQPPVRMFQQGSARRRVSIAVIPRQLMQFHSPESGQSLEDETIKPRAAEESPDRQSHSFQEDSGDNYFVLHAASPSFSQQNLLGTNSTECDVDRSRHTEGRKLELRSRSSIGKTVDEEPSEELGNKELNEECEEQRGKTLLCKGSKMELCRAWFSMPTYYWVLLWLFFLGIACLILIRILEVQKQYPFTTSDS
ncbi:inositol 1,4,5-triphosphate receptor associated 1-like isoform X2 [Rhineura floridana]|uniref:inositol 1,4,5-triphosphate receptor associated 1-like isoform X2 n=1 Tax=Rhineura floridana TaxID=261503 RepID=UPI002AC82523|nr:inositol 1,4,5-triphosphate receptor associated 1-like isoform X2 [Rhineura floridana]